MTEIQSLSDFARSRGISPKTISNMLWAGTIPADLLPTVGNRRVVTADVEPALVEILIAKGVIPAEVAPCR